MNFRSVCLAIFVLIFSACSRNVYDINYKGENNYDNFYVVDTIKIKDPVRIHSLKFGGQFIVSKSILKEYKNRIDFFYRPDVFIMGSDIYGNLPQRKYGRYYYPNDGGCELIKSSLDIKGLEIYEFRQAPASFLLGLINANYYYLKNNSYGSFAYPEKNNKISYYKLVFPLCNK